MLGACCLHLRPNPSLFATASSDVTAGFLKDIFFNSFLNPSFSPKKGPHFSVQKKASKSIKIMQKSCKIMQGWKVFFLREKTCWFKRSGHELNINNQPKQCFVEVKNQPNQHPQCHIFRLRKNFRRLLRPSWMKQIFVKSGHQTFGVKIYTPWN